ncbi:MAG TPA: hypothetical protein VFM55_14475 [Micromonosporaceae bacterium]|nr:hypothetical protein [Micromonosporaceae bacterium]
MLLLVGAGLGAGASPAYAAVPSNDEPTAATLISSLPSTVTQDTTAASYTTYGGCTSADAGANVWFALTVTEPVRLEVDTSSSDYNTGLNLFRGTPSGETWLACSERSLRFDAGPGATYYVEVAACCGSSSGGQLVLTARGAAPPPTVDVTVDSIATFDAMTGAATVSGTATCASSVENATVEVFLTQRVGRVSTVSGQNGTFVACEPGGGAVSWSVVVTPGNGLYRGGQASVSVQAVGCNNVECSAQYTDLKIRLRG